jgi:hypothetical protein
MDCEAPFRWRIESVDPRFGLSDLEATDAVRQAGMVWSEPLGMPLLFQEAPGGVTIRFVFDQRMEVALLRGSREAELEANAREIEEARIALDAARLALDRRRGAHDQRTFDLQGRQESHNRTVEAWNQAGGAPPAEFQRLQAIEAEIGELRRAVNAEAEEINGIVEEVNREAERLNRQIAGLNGGRASLEAEFPQSVVESAEYRQARGGLFSSGTREIDVFHFANRDHLIRVLAHVFGHALGLGHSETSGSLMEVNATASSIQGRPRLLPDDVAQLRALCPEL